jgi:hypothetical protein
MLTSNMLRFIFSFTSVVIMTSFSILVPILFVFGTSVANGFGYASQLYLFGGSVPVPFVLINATYNTVFLIGSVAVVMITFQFSEFILFGHISHSLVGKYRDRLPVISSYLIALLIFSLPVSFIFIAHYFAIVGSLKITMAMLLVGWLYTYTLTLITTLILNFNAVRKFALILMALVFIVGPGSFMMISNLLKSEGGIWGLLSYCTIELYRFLGLHMSLSRLIDFTISSSFFNWSELLGQVIYIVPYLLIIGLVYIKKDFA